MKREQIQAKFKQTAELARRGTAGERHAAEATLKGMIAVYPWLRDFARLMGLSLMPGITREFPWLAPAKASAAKTRRAGGRGRVLRGAAASKHGRKTSQSCATEQAAPWVKPPTEPGYEYKQCHKPTCRCMRGGAWHGPYRYHKRRDGDVVHSDYLGREVYSEVQSKKDSE